MRRVVLVAGGFLIAVVSGCGHESPQAPAVLTTLTVSLTSPSIQVGQTAAASASGLDQNGSPIALAGVTWSSAAPAIATVGAAGSIAGLAPGQTQIIATSGGKQAQATITVTPIPVATVAVVPGFQTIVIGGTTQLSAQTLDANGTALQGRAVSWSSSDPTKATVSTVGLVTGVSEGTAIITATSEGKSGTATISVGPVPVAGVTVSPVNATIAIGATQVFTATALDASGKVLTGRTFTWTASDPGVVSGTSTSAVFTATGVGNGVATITATSEGKSGSAAVSVGNPPVATVTLEPATASIAVGGTQAIAATARDANGNVLTGRTFSWTSTNLGVVTGTISGNVLTAQGVSAGTAIITATSEGKSGTSFITVGTPPPPCTAGTALQLAVGEVRTLTPQQAALLCLGGSAGAAEYALIPFGNSSFPFGTVTFQVTGTNTSPIVAPALGSRASASTSRIRGAADGAAAESHFRALERNQLASRMAMRGARRVNSARRDQLTSVPTTPLIGAVYSLNANLSGDLCGAKILHPARVVAVLPHTIVFVDTLAPAGGYSDAEMSAFGAAFDTLGFPLDTLNFGAPSDIDANGRVAIFFTTGINLVPVVPGTILLGIFTARDLFPVAGSSGCAGSNEGEIFYVPVPDPGKTINDGYTNKTRLANAVNPTLVHEFQHLINAGRRIYVNNAPPEEVWLNEGLSHVAEELLYYAVSGNSPRTNINAVVVSSSNAQLNAFNTYLSDGNFARLGLYLEATETNSPYAQNDILATRGAIWQLLRYAADRKGGVERSTWRALVNSTTAGQANFNQVFGDIVGMTRDWAVAQFTDDAGFAVASQYTNPSWNFRSIFPITQFEQWPLLSVTRSLPSGTSQSITLLAGGGAAYVRFRVAAGALATVASTAAGATPANVDFILVRTQ